eukprot:1787921-Pyramimonas_sp.AAC.1
MNVPPRCIRDRVDNRWNLGQVLEPPRRCLKQPARRALTPQRRVRLREERFDVRPADFARGDGHGERQPASHLHSCLLAAAPIAENLPEDGLVLDNLVVGNLHGDRRAQHVHGNLRAKDHHGEDVICALLPRARETGNHREDCEAPPAGPVHAVLRAAEEVVDETGCRRQADPPDDGQQHCANAVPCVHRGRRAERHPEMLRSPCGAFVQEDHPREIK